MKNIKSFNKLFESAPRIPRLNKRGLDYWKSKGKNGKDVMLYFHDDMDGIFSAVVVKERLIEMGYKIKGYGVVNYQEGWKLTSLDPKMINVAVDFANMPNPDRKDLIDIYIDHHGEFSEEEKDFYKGDPVIKTKTASAYEGICRVIGKPVDDILLYSIDMIDSAKYDDYNVKWTDILNFDWKLFKEISSKKGKVTIEPFKKTGPVQIGWPVIAKLTFAGAFNQYLKRSDHKTLIETVANLKDVSIYAIYNVMKRVYPNNNKWPKGRNAGQEKDFMDDGKWRIGEVKKRTRGDGKKIFMSQKEFYEGTNLEINGYKIIGKLMYVPSGTWANALRARSILQKDYEDGVIPKDHKVDFIMLQYGNTLQICGYNKIENIEELPKMKDGTSINDLGKYMTGLLDNFKKYFGYYDPDTKIGQDELTVSGGHVGIGTISNIVGEVDQQSIEYRGGKVNDFTEKYEGYRYLDLIKNKIINDLSGIDWKIGMKWPVSKDDEKGRLIRDILNNDENMQKQIKDYINIKISQPIPVKGEREYLERQIKKELREQLLGHDLKDLRKWHEKVMMDRKVMMSDEIRKMNKYGKFENMKNFKQFNENL